MCWKPIFRRGIKLRSFFFHKLPKWKTKPSANLNKVQKWNKDIILKKLSLTEWNLYLWVFVLWSCFLPEYSHSLKLHHIPERNQKNDMKMICHWLSYKIVWLNDLLLIDWCLLFPSYINISRIKKKRNNGAWRSTNSNYQIYLKLQDFGVFLPQKNPIYFSFISNLI